VSAPLNAPDSSVHQKSYLHRMVLLKYQNEMTDGGCFQFFFKVTVFLFVFMIRNTTRFAGRFFFCRECSVCSQLFPPVKKELFLAMPTEQMVASVFMTSPRLSGCVIRHWRTNPEKDPFHHQNPNPSPLQLWPNSYPHADSFGLF